MILKKIFIKIIIFNLFLRDLRYYIIGFVKDFNINKKNFLGNNM